MVTEKKTTDFETRHPWPWQDAELLRELHREKKYSVPEIADGFDCDESTIRKFLRRYQIPMRDTRGGDPLDPVPFRQIISHRQPYEAWDDSGNVVLVHRLIAVAEEGFAAVCGKVVHHRNNIPWDNRPANLQVMTRSEHSEVHSDPEYQPMEA